MAINHNSGFNHPFDKSYDWTSIQSGLEERLAQNQADLELAIATSLASSKLWTNVMTQADENLQTELLDKEDQVNNFVAEVVRLKQAYPDLTDCEIDRLLQATEAKNPELAERQEISKLLLIKNPAAPDAELIYIFSIWAS